MNSTETVWYDPRGGQLVVTWIDPMVARMRMYQFSDDGNVYATAWLRPRMFGWIKLGRL